MTLSSLTKQTSDNVHLTVIVDGVFFQINQTGIARVWQTLLTQWSHTPFAHNLVVIDRGNTAPKIEGLTYFSMALYDYRDAALESEKLQAVCDKFEADLFISTYYTTPLRTPTISMIYDMVPEVIALDLTEDCWQEKHYAILSAQRYITISQNTAADLIYFYPHLKLDQIDVVHLGVDSIFRPCANDIKLEIQHQLSIKLPYFVLVGSRLSLKGYKNGILFFKALKKWHRSSEFAVVCVGGEPELEPELLACFPQGNIHLVRLDDRQLAAIYSGAIALIYPSLYEGFGLPIIEAMACGCPVITCRNSSIPEVAGEAALYVDEKDEFEMIKALEQVLVPGVRQALIEAGYGQAQKFSWQQTADQIKQIFTQFITNFQQSNPAIPGTVLLWQTLRSEQKKLEEIRHLLGFYDPNPTDLIQSMAVELSQTKEALVEAHQEIATIKSSKFWLLRDQWLKFKKKLKSKTDPN